MNIESSVVFRRVARIACLVLIAGLLPASAAMAQLPITITPGNPPPVLSGSVIPFNHGATGQWSQVYSMRIAPSGNILFLDSALSKLYQLAPGASEPSLVVGPGQQSSGANSCASLDAAGDYFNAGIALDSANNLYVGNRYSSIATFCRVPYTAASNSWNFQNATVFGPPTITSGGNSVVLNPQELFIVPCSGSCTTNTMFFSTSGAAGGDAIYELTVNVSTGAISNLTPVITNLQDFAASISVDHAGNLYFVENIYPTPVKERVPGILEVPAGVTGLVASGSGSEATLSPPISGKTGSSANFTGIGGITFDAQGNLYFGSVNNASYAGYVDGVFMIPNEGTPTSPSLNWDDTVMVSPVNGAHEPLVDPRGFLWIATGGSSNWAPAGTAAPTCDATTTQTVEATCLASTIVIWKPGTSNLASGAAGGSTPVAITAYSVPAAGGTLILTANNSFTEDEVVTISAPNSSDPLYPLNGLGFFVQESSLSSTQFAVSTSLLSGGASGATSATATLTPYSTVYYTFNAATTPASFSFGLSNNDFKIIPNPTPDTGLTTPVLPCTAGTTYPAFSATEETSTNPSTDYSWCSLFVQLTTTAPGAVESDVQMLNSGSAVITGSNAFLGGVGQGAAISSVATPTVSTIASSGLSEPEQVAVDSQGGMYVADKGLKAIEYYPAGTTDATSGIKALGGSLSGPTGVAVDGAGDLFIGDSGYVYEIPYIDGKLQTTERTVLASGLGSQLSLAVDSMGDVFAADQTKAQVVEIPNPQSALLRQSLSLLTLGTSANFTGPTAIATDNSGNVWVADGTNLWEITMPFGGIASSPATTKLPTGVTGLAIDPSGSVFVTSASGLYWIPYQSSGLDVNGEVLMASTLGSGSVAPVGVALDGLENAYADYGSSTTAGLAQLSMNGTINFNNTYSEITPGSPDEVDAGLYNLGNTPLTLAAFSPNNGGDTFTGSSDYSILQAANFNTPACSSSTGVSPGNWCYLGLQILAAAANPADTATLTVESNAENVPATPSGLSLALSATVIADPRPATQIQVSFTPVISSGCFGSTYPGCQTATVTVTSAAGTPSGSVTLLVPGSGVNQDNQTATLVASSTADTATATFSLTNLSGGPYPVLATYGGEGELLPTPCTGASCFAGSAVKTTLTISTATPAFTVGPPGSEGCLSWTATNCTPDPTKVQSYLGTDFVQYTTSNWFTALVTSSVGTPTGSVSFLVNGQPVDPTQLQNSLSGTGLANFTLVNLPIGTYTITAQYNGDQNYSREDIVLPTFQVISPSIEITANPAAVTTKAGTPVQATLSLEPLVGFNGFPSLECVSATLPQYAECTFAYPNTGQGTVGVGQPNTTPPSTVVVTISTNVPVNSGTASLSRQAPWALAGLFGAGLLGLIAGRKRVNRYLTMVCLAVMLSGAFMAVTSCTNAGYSTPLKAPPVQTPTGTYNVRIISYNPASLLQNSLANTPAYTLQLTVQ